MGEERELPFELSDDERLEVAAWTEPAIMAITDRRMIVGSATAIALDVPIAAIRRIQLDVERARPATLVIVPHQPSDPPQVLAVPHEELDAVTRAVALLGLRLQALD